MLYLAYVQKTSDSGDTKLCLLAYQKTDQLWQMVMSETVNCDHPDLGAAGNLVLVKMSENQQVITVENAKDWVVGLVKEYLSYPPLTPEWVEKEQARIEQGRQEITAKNLDLTRRQLELETQREQVQALENQLKKKQTSGEE